MDIILDRNAINVYKQGYLCCAQPLLPFYTDCFETSEVILSWFDDGHVVFI